MVTSHANQGLFEETEISYVALPPDWTWLTSRKRNLPLLGVRFFRVWHIMSSRCPFPCGSDVE